MNYYEHHIGDYDADTAHLAWVEDMAYSRLLRLYYRREKPIPADISEACRLVRARTREEKKAVTEMLAEFFSLEADGWHQARCDSEISDYQIRVEHNRRVGKLGGRPKKQKPGGLPEHNPPGSLPEPERNPLGSFREPEHNPPQTPDPRPQTNTEDRGKGTARKRATPPPDRPDDVPEQTWADWVQLRKGKRAAVTETLLAEARTEAEKAGLTLERFLAAWCLRGSQGFSADWLRPEERRPINGNAAEPGWRRKQRERTQEAAPYAAVGGRASKPIFDIEEIEDEKRILPPA